MSVSVRVAYLGWVVHLLQVAWVVHGPSLVLLEDQLDLVPEEESCVHDDVDLDLVLLQAEQSTRQSWAARVDMFTWKQMLDDERNTFQTHRCTRTRTHKYARVHADAYVHEHKHTHT